MLSLIAGELWRKSMSSSIAKDIYEGFKKIITIEDRISQLAESVKRTDGVVVS